MQAEAGRFELLFHQPGLLRPLGMAELSDAFVKLIEAWRTTMRERGE